MLIRIFLGQFEETNVYQSGHCIFMGNEDLFDYDPFDCDIPLLDLIIDWTANKID